MTRGFQSFFTGAGVLCCLAAMNVLLVAFVVILDVCLGIAPQFGVPLVSGMLITGGATAWVAIQAKRSQSTADAQQEVFGVHTRRARRRPRDSSQPSATFRSAMIIRRRPAAGAPDSAERETTYAKASMAS